MITLSEKDWNTIDKVLENPPKPSERLIKAAQTYKEIIKNVRQK